MRFEMAQNKGATKFQCKIHVFTGKICLLNKYTVLYIPVYHTKSSEIEQSLQME